MKTRISHLLSAAAIASSLSWSAQAATLQATYLFDGSLLAEESGAPALVAIDPLDRDAFETAIVFGNTRTVYRFDGTVSQQGGLSLSTAGLVNRTQYSVEMVFDLTGTDRFRRIIDTKNRTSDHGIYVDPNDKLTTWTGINNPGGLVSDNGFAHVTLTVSGNDVRTYVNGVLGRTVNTNKLHISNADRLHFFLDNTSSGGQGEYSGGALALLRLYSGALDANEVANLAAGPLPSQGPIAITPAPVPLPGSLVLLGSSLVASMMLRRRSA